MFLYTHAFLADRRCFFPYACLGLVACKRICLPLCLHIHVFPAESAFMSAHARVSGRVCLYVCTCTCFRQSLPLCLHMHVFPAKPAFMSAHARVSGKACLYVCTYTRFRQSLPLCLHMHVFSAESAFCPTLVKVLHASGCVCVCVCVCV